MRRAALPLDVQPEMVVQLCQHLGLSVRARFEPSGDDQLFPNRITVEGPDAQWLLANRGMGLDALQYLLHEAQGDKDEARLTYLDVHTARLFRMREMTAMVGYAVAKTRELGSYSFSSLNPRERRWVHLLVGREADLHSESEGTGSMKSLKVTRRA